MSNRKSGRTWCAPAVPAIVAKMRAAEQNSLLQFEQIAATAARTGSPLPLRPDQLHRALDDIRDDLDHLDRATLFWATARMTRMAVESGAGLPEWTPGMAMPCDEGIVLWEVPAGRLGWSDQYGAVRHVDWDGIWWSLRGQRLEIRLLSRCDGARDGLSARYADTSVMSVLSLWCPAWEPRTEEAQGSADAVQMLSTVGAAWLLMGQPRVAETRVLTEADGVVVPKADRRAGRIPVVSLVDLRRPASPASEQVPQSGSVQWTRRWWVGGHWRQQACGPNRAQRKPVWIAPHVKGPDDKPLVETPRVHIWRR